MTSIEQKYRQNALDSLSSTCGNMECKDKVQKRLLKRCDKCKLSICPSCFELDGISKELTDIVSICKNCTFKIN